MAQRTLRTQLVQQHLGLLKRIHGKLGTGKQRSPRPGNLIFCEQDALLCGKIMNATTERTGSL
jgi:hypothetical protein